ncbi:hypothetical protein [Ochrovirga pacifica]|uniref:hypothetical protein n=1 Tax=Ochrovirga pacifica TaxID=1042376 RepID=UPI0002559DEF|nr:hypothetical protein [Ochrovirga pacifica]
MDTANIRQLKTELENLNREELSTIVLRLAKFKKENKELLSYLLFESSDESNYVLEIKKEMDLEFASINTQSYYYIKKSVRKILKNTKTYIRYSNCKETEVELLLYFCKKLRGLSPSISRNQQLLNIFVRELKLAERKIASLHPDLQYDYQQNIDILKK